MKTKAGRPAAAAAAAVAPARFPVEAQASASTPNSTARAAAIATARSLKLSDGLRVSSLIHSRSTPEGRGEAIRGEERRRAHRQRTGRRGVDREQLGIPPDAGLPTRDRPRASGSGRRRGSRRPPRAARNSGRTRRRARSARSGRSCGSASPRMRGATSDGAERSLWVGARVSIDMAGSREANVMASGPGTGSDRSGELRGSEGSSLISQEVLPGFGTLPTRRR